MSRDVKPLVFRTLEGQPVVPSWLRHASNSVSPLGGPFQRPPEDEDEDQQDEQGEPEPFPQALPARESGREPKGESVPRPMRRSSLPPRMSAPPPPVVITRPPPAIVEPEIVRITPAEQEAYAHAALELGSLRARVLFNAESQLLDLAVSIAEVLIERAVERDPSLHNAFARAAVAALGDTRAAKLRVSRDAFRAISELHGEEAVDVDGVRVELMLDNSLEGLSVVAESGASRVDGRVRERLAAVLRTISADHRQKGAEEDE
ncbi:MAG: Flagellar assembly protein FliH [Pseudomonadota bacterium]